MPPRKKAKDAMDQFKSDHELFLQAFEKPTQIYRFLGARQLVSPIFLQRTLCYMKHRMSRTHKNRKLCKVDNILAKVISQQNQQMGERPIGNLNLTFMGYHDTINRACSETVVVEAILNKVCFKKRKETSNPVMQTPVGKCEVLRNPDPSCPPENYTAISVPSDYFNLSNGHLVKSYSLTLRVICNPSKMKVNGICNGDISDIDEPPQKKRKNLLKGLHEDCRLYYVDLVVYDKFQRCLLVEGDYQLALREYGQKSITKKTSSWETFPETHESEVMGLFDVFSKGPLVSLHLAWSNNSKAMNIERPLPVIRPKDFYKNGWKSLINGVTSQNINNHQGNTHALEKPKKLRIFYQFLYNNNTRQQTEARDDLRCPWCKVNCTQLYCLLKHLKLCHSRFIFNYIPHPKGARIDVSINDSYDGSYVGNPHDVHNQTGFTFGQLGPTRRNPVTRVIVCRPKRTPPSLSEFIESEEVVEPENHRSYISGHNRVYYHTGTCLTVRPQEIDEDSESENDPEWLRTKTQIMIDEFTDVNEGEKELMKMWNLHVMKYSFVGDCQIPLACSMFIDENGRRIIENRLYHNFLLHLCNLFDFGLISASVVYHTMRQLMQLRDELENKRPIIKKPL